MAKHLETNTMDKAIERALEATITTFLRDEQQESRNTLTQQINTIFNAESAFMDKVTALDALLDDVEKLAPLKEYLFDLLLMNFFAADVQKLEADYLDSQEWEEIEESTLDRGTELLNLLLYLGECEDEEIEPELSDYLTEFLLVDEDEFQDEHRIYEPVIAQQLLVDSSFQQIAKAAATVDDEEELFELFYVLLGFFHAQYPTEEEKKDFKEHAPNQALDTSLYALLTTYVTN